MRILVTISVAAMLQSRRGPRFRREDGTPAMGLMVSLLYARLSVGIHSDFIATRQGLSS
jgi:hypothetical protein